MSDEKRQENEQEIEGEIQFETTMDTEAMDIVTRLYSGALKELVER